MKLIDCGRLQLEALDNVIPGHNFLNNYFRIGSPFFPTKAEILILLEQVLEECNEES